MIYMVDHKFANVVTVLATFVGMEISNKKTQYMRKEESNVYCRI